MKHCTPQHKTILRTIPSQFFDALTSMFNPLACCQQVSYQFRVDYYDYMIICQFTSIKMWMTQNIYTIIFTAEEGN